MKLRNFGLALGWEHVTFAESGNQGRLEITEVATDSSIPMTPEQQQAIQQHIRGIAQILYEDAPKEQLTTLAGIESAVRQQMLEHVMPEVGIFLSKTSQAQQQDADAP